MDDRVCSWLWVFDVFRILLFSEPMVVSPLLSLDNGALCAYELDTNLIIYTTAVSHVFAVPLYNTVHSGWVDGFVGVTAARRTAVLL